LTARSRPRSPNRADPGTEDPAPRAPDIEIGLASGPAEVEAVRALFLEYAHSLPVDLAFQGFDREVAELPGEYSAPRGTLLLARVGGSPAGCVALRRAPDGQGEVKRLYVRPEFRGLGIGRTLVETLIEAARGRGYRSLCLDTLPTMESGYKLYRSLGFEEVGPYYETPVVGTRFLRRDLTADDPSE
jgi:putative acetyltransferase